MIQSDYPAATPHAVAAFESSLGTSLPEPYRAFLLRHNGGAPEPDIVFISDAEGETDLRMLYGLNGDEHYDLRDNADVFRGRMPSELLPIGTDSGGNQFCLAVHGPKYGAVFFWDHEREAEDSHSVGYENITRVGTSFDVFLNSLRELDVNNLPEPKVLSVWIDPAFLEEQRQKGNTRS